MVFEAKILADSVSPANVRLTTFEVTFPRIVLAEFNTHRVFSRNSASSRAIPVENRIKRVRKDPYIPTSWGKNQKGMQAAEEFTGHESDLCKREWLAARDSAVRQAERLQELGLHKQLTNRLLEPFMWHTCIVTATEWSNFFHLRNNAMAQPEIQIPARMMQQLYESNEPEKLDYGEWHLPLVGQEDYDKAFEDNPKFRQGFATKQEAEDDHELRDLMIKISVGRCARVSYLTHDGKRDPAADIALHDSLLAAGHMSPFEHVARPTTLAYPVDQGPFYTDEARMWSGNLRGWTSYRKLIPHEHDILGALS
jgi:thymidylate synthase ThyX